MAMTGGDLLAQLLRAEGVDVVFGIVDGSYFGLCEGLRRTGIRLVSPRHETSAVHMAGHTPYRYPEAFPMRTFRFSSSTRRR